MPRSLSPGAPLVILALAGALTVVAPAGAASNLQYRLPLLPMPAGRLPGRLKPPVTLLPTRPAPPRAELPVAPIGPAKLPPQKTYPYAPGTIVVDHRYGRQCSYVVGSESSWCQYWTCEHPHGGHGHPRVPPPPWPYPAPHGHVSRGVCG